MKKVKFSLISEEEEILELISKNPRGLCIKEIAKKLDTNEKTISKRVDILARANLIEERIIGTVKLFYPKEEDGIH